MKISETVEVMRKLVEAYDRFENVKLKLKAKRKSLKGGNFMKFGTVLGIVVGALALLAAGAAAMYFYLNKGGCCCDDCCDDFDDDLFDEFDEELYEEEKPIIESEAEEDIKF